MKRIIPLLLILLIPFVISCTKQRPATFSEDQADNLYTKEQFQTAVTIQTAEVPQALSNQVQAVQAVAEKNQINIKNVDGPDYLQPMFKDLSITAQAQKTYTVQFAIDRKYITAYKVVDSADELSIEEQEISQKVNNKIQVPIFQYKINSYGVPVRIKNALGEDTSQLRLKETKWEDATHISVSLIPGNRTTVAISASDKDLREQVFLKQRISNAIFSKNDLNNNLHIAIDATDNTLFYTAVDGKKLNLFEVTSFDKLTNDQQQIILAQDKNNLSGDEIARCSEDILNKIPSNSIKNCVIILRYKAPLSYVLAQRKVEELDGVLGSEIEIKNTDAGQTSPLVQIAKNVELENINPVDQNQWLSPTRTLVVNDIIGKEFFFRRTLQDSPNGFDFTFAGSSGPLEIVHFQFDKDKVRIVRADPVMPTNGSTSVDQETLISLPVKYYKKVFVDTQGEATSTPRYIETVNTDTNAIAYVDWTQNSIPNISSPLNYYELEQCFTGTREQEVSDVDQRLTTGNLNFTLASTYVNNPSIDCAGIGKAGYFDTVQTSFTFKERFSFKEYKKTGTESPLFSLPFDAQKRLGLGFFTYNKNVPDKFGNAGTDTTQIPLAAVFDLKNGKQIHYTLAGLPEDKVLRDRIIQATKEVINDWNKAFQIAFKDTPMERSADVLVLDNPDDTGVLGDLDKNFIYYVEKRTQSSVIGLGGAHANPRTGEVESASVYIYGGNILGYVESINNVAQAKKNYQSAHSAATLTPSISQTQMQLTSNSNMNLQNNLTIGSKQYSDMASRLNPANTNKLAALKTIPALQSAMDFQNAFQAAMSDGVLNENTLQMLINDIVIKQPGLSPMAINKLKAEKAHSNAIAQVIKNLEASNICAYEAEDIPANASPVGDNDMDTFISVYKPTLAHEIGHNLGLRHNFIASFDKANWKIDANDTSKRNYSSIMDYLADDNETYDGIGPQDIASLRAAYAGLIELDPSVVDKNSSKKYIAIEDYKKAIGLDSWLNLNSDIMKKLPLRKYLFCSDEDAGLSPQCQRFDKGGTPEEVVANIASDYQTLYALRNMPNDRVQFGYVDQGAYVSRMFARLLPVRQYLEETFFQAINGASPDTINHFATATFNGMQFFHSIIRTPDAPASANRQDRFVKTTNSDGTQITVERKWLNDVALDPESDRLLARGIELDKLIAMIMLTKRDFGFPRYERISLQVAYPDFEKLIFADQAKTPLDLPTIGLLTEILNNNITPAASTANGMVALNSQFKSDTTALLRYYVAISSMAYLDVDGLDVTDNSSSFFRVMSSFAAPATAKFVVQPGVKSNSPTELRYWAFDNAVAANSLVNRNFMLSSIASIKDQLLQNMQKWLVAVLQNPKLLDAKDPASDDFAKLTQDINTMLASLPADIGPQNMNDIGNFMMQVIQLATQEQSQAAMPLDQFATLLQSVAKQQPILGIALLAIPAQNLNLTVLQSALPTRFLEEEQMLVFRNIQNLNAIFFALHPEYRR